MTPPYCRGRDSIVRFVDSISRGATRRRPRLENGRCTRERARGASGLNDSPTEFAASVHCLDTPCADCKRGLLTRLAPSLPLLAAPHPMQRQAVLRAARAAWRARAVVSRASAVAAQEAAVPRWVAAAARPQAAPSQGSRAARPHLGTRGEVLLRSVEREQQRADRPPRAVQAQQARQEAPRLRMRSSLLRPALIGRPPPGPTAQALRLSLSTPPRLIKPGTASAVRSMSLAGAI